MVTRRWLIDPKHSCRRLFTRSGPFTTHTVGYARVSKADGSQSLDLQRDALQAAGGRDDRPGLDSCVRALRTGDVLVVWKLDRLGRTLAHLVTTVQDLSTRGVGLAGAHRARCADRHHRRRRPCSGREGLLPTDAHGPIRLKLRAGEGLIHGHQDLQRKAMP